MSLDIEGVLSDLGIDILRVTGDELVAKCPQHFNRTGKEDSRPSWSINSTSLAHHCFSCGYSGSLVGLYRDMTGAVPEDLSWEIAKTSVISKVIERPVVEEPKGPAVNEWMLMHYADLPDKLISLRQLKRSSIDAFQIRWDTERKMWVIPVRSPKGDLWGYQFRQKGKVLNHPPGMTKGKTLFGLHLLTEDRAMVVESPLDVVRLHGIGIPAVATFGASISDEQLTILSRNLRIIVAAMDNDPAGAVANRRLQYLKNRCVVLPFDYGGLEAKDPGDIEDDRAVLSSWYKALALRLHAV